MTRTDPSTTNTVEEQNKQTVRRFFEAFGAADEASMHALMTPDFRAHSVPPDLTPDAEGFIRMAAAMHAGLRDCRTEIHDLVAEDDRAAARFTTHAVHGGELFGIPPTGRPVTMAGMEFYRLASGRIAEFWGEYDLSGITG